MHLCTHMYECLYAHTHMYACICAHAHTCAACTHTGTHIHKHAPTHTHCPTKTTKHLFVSNLSSTGLICFYQWRAENIWLVTYLIPLPHKPHVGLVMTSLRCTLLGTKWQRSFSIFFIFYFFVVATFQLSIFKNRLRDQVKNCWVSAFVFIPSLLIAAVMLLWFVPSLMCCGRSSTYAHEENLFVPLCKLMLTG